MITDRRHLPAAFRASTSQPGADRFSLLRDTSNSERSRRSLVAIPAPSSIAATYAVTQDGVPLLTSHRIVIAVALSNLQKLLINIFFYAVLKADFCASTALMRIRGVSLHQEACSNSQSNACTRIFQDFVVCRRRIHFSCYVLGRQHVMGI